MTTKIYITAGAKEYIGGTVLEKNSKDLTSDTFEVGLSSTSSAPTTWIAPDVSTVGIAPIVVDGVTISVNAQRILNLLVSSSLPTGSPLVSGSTYSIWARIHDAPEIAPRLLQSGIIAV